MQIRPILCSKTINSKNVSVPFSFFFYTWDFKITTLKWKLHKEEKERKETAASHWCMTSTHSNKIQLCLSAKGFQQCWQKRSPLNIFVVWNKLKYNKNQLFLAVMHFVALHLCGELWAAIFHHLSSAWSDLGHKIQHNHARVTLWGFKHWCRKPIGKYF